jgi:hypothetical protein
MAGVFQNIDPSPPGECVPPAFGAGGGHTLVGEGGRGLIFWKTSDTALYSKYVSTLWGQQFTSWVENTNHECISSL